ncbi:hypothetical protein Tco_0637773 [Tanacetum coccineum]
MLTMRARRFLKNNGRKLDMANKERIRTSPRWSVSTATREDTLQGSVGYNWSDQAEEGPTNFALMAYSSTSSSSSTNSEETDIHKRMTKLSTEWKSMKRRRQIEAKKSIKSKGHQISQTVKVKVNPEKINQKKI